ncbi:MAG: response regulator transcription factor [Paludibacteraceae bacterium]
MNPTQTSVLIADGDINLSTVLADYLRSISFTVDVTNNAETTSDAIKRKKYDICLMELSFADGSGFEIMKTLRDSNNTLPIVVLSTRSGRDDVIRSFELGCDDYITKPFSMDILILRIRAILRRYHAGESKPETVFDINGRMFDSVHQTFDGKHMSSRESDLMLLLCRNLNQLVERHVILSALWKTEDYFSSRSLSVYVNHLRGFLNETGYRIIGVHGKGYKMVDNK